MRAALLSACRSIVLIAATASHASAGDLPDPHLTPGEANPALTREFICAPVFRTKLYRNVDSSLRRHAYAAYGIQPRSGACAGGCELDHLISIELGGTNSLTNLWPQRYDGKWGAHAKDKLENRLHRLVCDGALTLQEAQDEIATDWIASYLRHVAGNVRRPHRPQ